MSDVGMSNVAKPFVKLCNVKIEIPMVETNDHLALPRSHEIWDVSLFKVKIKWYNSHRLLCLTYKNDISGFSTCHFKLFKTIY